MDKFVSRSRVRIKTCMYLNFNAFEVHYVPSKTKKFFKFGLAHLIGVTLTVL